MRLSHLLTLLAGGAVVALAVLASRSGRNSQPQPRAKVEPRATVDPRIDRLLTRLERLEERLARPPAPPAAAAPDDALSARLDRLETLLVALQASAPAARAGRVATETLRLRAKGLATDLTKAADAIEAWGAVARQAQDPEAKAEAWFEQGEVYRKLEDYAGAAAAWQKVVDTVGLRSTRGQTAAYQLGWAHARARIARSSSPGRATTLKTTTRAIATMTPTSLRSHLRGLCITRS